MALAREYPEMIELHRNDEDLFEEMRRECISQANVLGVVSQEEESENDGIGLLVKRMMNIHSEK